MSLNLDYLFKRKVGIESDVRITPEQKRPWMKEFYNLMNACLGYPYTEKVRKTHSGTEIRGYFSVLYVGPGIQTAKLGLKHVRSVGGKLRGRKVKTVDKKIIDEPWKIHGGLISRLSYAMDIGIGERGIVSPDTIFGRIQGSYDVMLKKMADLIRKDIVLECLYRFMKYYGFLAVAGIDLETVNPLFEIINEEFKRCEKELEHGSLLISLNIFLQKLYPYIINDKNIRSVDLNDNEILEIFLKFLDKLEMYGGSAKEFMRHAPAESGGGWFAVASTVASMSLKTGVGQAANIANRKQLYKDIKAFLEELIGLGIQQTVIEDILEESRIPGFGIEFEAIHALEEGKFGIISAPPVAPVNLAPLRDSGQCCGGYVDIISTKTGGAFMRIIYDWMAKDDKKYKIDVYDQTIYNNLNIPTFYDKTTEREINNVLKILGLGKIPA